MSGREKLAQEPLRILVHVGHDTLLQQADFTCDLADHFCFPAGDRRRDRVHQASTPTASRTTKINVPAADP